jgi:class 3 adenylate cyclase
MLAAYFDVARGIIGGYGGDVAKFIGDAVVAGLGISDDP